MNIKTYEPVLKQITAQYDPLNGNYFISIGDKDVGHIHDCLFETLFIETKVSDGN